MKTGLKIPKEYHNLKEDLFMKFTLYGDGIHDDYPAIQEMIDSGACEISLPVPKKNYLISKTLILPSNLKLILPRFAEIKLADGANCLMIKNKMVPDKAERLPEYSERFPEDMKQMFRHLWYYVNDYSPEAVTENIEICGGIWNCNNKNQLPNPEQTKVLEPYGYTGEGMLFYGVRNMKLSSITLKDPVHWGISLDRVSYFTIENITFDYNYGNPYAVNMDGVHLNGNCHFGVIRNLKGACYDDLVALNASEGSRGSITNIEIEGLFAETCHSAVRLLTDNVAVENIHISNVYGTYYQYCIGLTKYAAEKTTAAFDGITIDHVYASKAVRGDFYPWPNSYVYPLIYFQPNIWVKNIKISDMYRKEYNVPVETIHIGKDAVVDNFMLDNIVTENHTGKHMPMIVSNGGIVNRWDVRNIFTDGENWNVGK